MSQGVGVAVFSHSWQTIQFQKYIVIQTSIILNLEFKARVCNQCHAR